MRWDGGQNRGAKSNDARASSSQESVDDDFTASLAYRSANLTELEIPRLTEPFNLTDGHVHRSWIGPELEIVSQVSNYFENFSREKQKELEQEFISIFHKLSMQCSNQKHLKHLLCVSASMSIEIVANYLRLNNLSVALIEPCFDNIADILRRHKVRLTAIPENVLRDPALLRHPRYKNVDVVFFVSPNNPTGIAYNSTTLKEIGIFCRDNNTTLIIDSSFRFYKSEFDVFDEYKLLSDIGVNFIMIEDTGKTWPTHDLKISILTSSEKTVYRKLHKIYTDFILHVPPFTLKLLIEFMKISIKDGLYLIRSIVRTNRETLHHAVEGTSLRISNEPWASVAWLEIADPHDSQSIVRSLNTRGVFVLPGNQFFWNNSALGSKNIRIALTRNTDKFDAAASVINDVMKSVS